MPAPDVERRSEPESPSVAEDVAEGPRRRAAPRDLLTLAAVLIVVGYLWSRASTLDYWVDEGIAVGISSHSFTSIPGILRQDGSPPLYYLILHVWMAMFGSSEVATHLLSLGFALATIPAALWAGWSLFGRRVGWMFAALMALNPFLASYANETRMYTLLALLALLASATFAHAFVFRRRRYLPAFSLLLTLVIYTHNWGLFFGFAAGVAALVCAGFDGFGRRVIIDAALAFGGAAFSYLPWLPSLLLQLAHTGTPFARTPTLLTARNELMEVFGSREALVALGIGAVAGLAPVLRRPLKRDGRAVVALAILPVVVIVVAWLMSQEESVWQSRYLTVALAPIALVFAVGLAHAGRMSIACLVVYGFLTAPIQEKQRPTSKSDAKLVTQRFGPQLRPGDLVVTNFGRIPLLSYYLPPGLRYFDAASGVVPDERRTDQRDSVKRLRAANPRLSLPPLVESLPVGGHVVVVCHSASNTSAEDPEFVQLDPLRCNEAERLMLEMEGLELRDAFDPDPQLPALYASVKGRLFLKVTST